MLTSMSFFSSDFAKLASNVNLSFSDLNPKQKYRFGDLAEGVRLFVAVRDPSLCEVIWRHLKGDAITSEYSNTVASKLTGQMRKHRPVLVQLNAE